MYYKCVAKSVIFFCSAITSSRIRNSAGKLSEHVNDLINNLEWETYKYIYTDGFVVLLQCVMV